MRTFKCSSMELPEQTITAVHPAIAAERFVDFIEPRSTICVTVSDDVSEWHYDIVWRPTIYEDI